ncbi:hypothetical protein [Parvibaculum sp.]|uniref:hypothetical protein n=1 Tax=Parvibaculum sp. TaxID=2024848 RepID=UPI00391D8445
MTNIRTVYLDIEISSESIALLCELNTLTCKHRAFASVSSDGLAMHFSSLSDAVAFLDLISFLLEDMTEAEKKSLGKKSGK